MHIHTYNTIDTGYIFFPPVGVQFYMCPIVMLVASNSTILRLTESEDLVSMILM